MPINPQIEKSAIQDTSVDSIISKHSCATLGYIDDKFSKYFSKTSVRRAPVINRGYYARTKATELVVLSFLENFKHTEKQVVVFGGGFDTLYFRLKKKGKKFQNFIELDYPEICREKSDIIEKNEELFTKLENPFFDIKGSVRSKDYQLIGVDFTDLDQMDTRFNEFKIDFSIPTLFISEFVFIYIDSEATKRVIEWTTKKFNSDILYFLYDLIINDQRFINVMLKNLKIKNIKLKSVQSYPTLKSQENRFAEFGFVVAKAIDMNKVFYEFLPEEEIERVKKLEIFDEVEEFHLMMGNYCMVLASRSKNANTNNLGFLSMK